MLIADKVILQSLHSEQWVYSVLTLDLPVSINASDVRQLDSIFTEEAAM